MPTSKEKADAPAPAELAKRFKHFRKLQKLTQMEFAEKIHISQAMIVRYENATHLINTEVIKTLHTVFGMSYDWFFEGMGKPTDKPEKRSITTDINDIKTDNSLFESRLKQLEQQVKTLTRELYALKHRT